MSQALWKLKIESVNQMGAEEALRICELRTILMLAISLGLAAIVTWLADTMYYTNRNVKYWVQIEVSSTILFMLFSATI